MTALMNTTFLRTGAVVAVLVVGAAAAVLRPWEGAPQPGIPLVVKGGDIFACDTRTTLNNLYKHLRETDEAGFVREGQRLTSEGLCIYVGRGVKVLGYPAHDSRLVRIRHEKATGDWLAPRAVFETNVN